MTEIIDGVHDILGAELVAAAKDHVVGQIEFKRRRIDPANSGTNLPLCSSKAVNEFARERTN